MSENHINSLEEQARKRKEKIKELQRKRKCVDETTESRQETINDLRNLPTPKFRSYKPQDKNLMEHLLKKPDSSDVKAEVKDLLDLAKSDMTIDQVDISTLAPRQPDWDLKRDVEKKLEKLARRTQKAMAELIREKLKEKQDLAEIPNAPADI